MINCQNSETYFSAFYDKELTEDSVQNLTNHMSTCGSCESEYNVYEKAMDGMNHLNFGVEVDSLTVPTDFTQNVMARVRVSQPQSESAGTWKMRAVGFVVIFLAYAVYMLSVTPVKSAVESELDLSRSLVIFNLLLVGLSLSFMFFTKEFVGVNSKLLSRLSASYQQVTSKDINLLRLVGASVFMGVVIGKFIF